MNYLYKDMVFSILSRGSWSKEKAMNVMNMQVDFIYTMLLFWVVASPIIRNTEAIYLRILSPSNHEADITQFLFSLIISASLSADKASGLFDDDSLVIDLPTNVMQYLTSEMDIGPNYGKGWVELAALKNYIFSRVIRIKGNQSIQSPFQYLLGQQEFSGYTYGQLKRDLQILPRLDILRKLQSGNFI